MRPIVRVVLGLATALLAAACTTGATSAPTSLVTPAATSPVQPTAAPASPDGTAAAAVCSEVSDGSATVEASIEGFAFVPATVSAKVGDVISWTNADGAPHGIALDDGSCRTGNAGRGSAVSLTFAASGEYAFHCTVHGTSMVGKVVVTE
jgi:plastocyanin